MVFHKELICILKLVITEMLNNRIYFNILKGMQLDK